MKLKVGVLVVAAAALALLAPAAAQARTITIGSPLTGAFPVNATFLLPSVTIVNSTSSDPEAKLASPVDGVVVRWRLVPQLAADSFSLRVLRPAGGGLYTGAGTSLTRVASTTALQTFPTNLPIRAGDTVGIESLKPTSTFKAAAVTGLLAPYWSPALSEGASLPPTGTLTGLEIGFNADVQPAPRVVLVGPAAGLTTGGTGVTIAGSDFTGVTGVRFGALPAASYVVDSESQITATAPAAAGPGSVVVTVTTNAGTSPAAPGAAFTYTAPAPTCVVPKLTGKKLKADRKALGRAKCKLGKVTGKRGKDAKVVKQNPKPGTVKPSGAAVDVKLG